MTSIASQSLFFKPSLIELLSDLQPGRTERHGPCFRCGGADRFVVFLDSGRGWCRQCHWRGDSIQLLMDRDGLTFREAKRHLGLETITAPSVKRKATVQSRAVASAKRAYLEWQRTQLSARAAAYRALSAAIAEAESGYRATVRQPALYTEDEREFWPRRLALLYDRVAVLENELDILTYSRHEAARFAWWTSESEGHYA